MSLIRRELGYSEFLYNMKVILCVPAQYNIFMHGENKIGVTYNDVPRFPGTPPWDWVVC